MACTANKAALLRIIASRGYAAQANPQTAVKSSKIQQQTLPNKLVVAAAESSLPVSRVSIVFRAGARNEEYENLGASHLLRLSAGLSTKNATGFAITRNLQQIGGRLIATSDRELVSFTIETTADKLETGLKYLEHVATAPAFKPWEISDSVPRLKVELDCIPDQVKAVELLHKAAFRQGLGNSVFCPRFQAGRISSETLHHYYSQNCRTNRCAVVGVGVDFNLLVGYAQNLRIESGEGKETASKYYGAVDLRKNRAGNLAHVAVAGEGGALSDLKETVAFAILQRAAGLVPVTKRGGFSGPLGKAISSAVGGSAITVSALNASYADSGLFGFILTTDADKAGKAVEAGIKALKSGSVSEGDIKRGKAALKASILRRHETDSGLLSDISAQAALLDKVQNVDEINCVIDGICTADVQNAAKKVACSQLSMGAIGNLSTVPYVVDF